MPCKDKKRRAAISKAWAAAHPQQAKAGHVLRQAVKRGKIAKPSACERCFKATKLQGHHSDYSKPLEVQWLCAPCHKEIHRAS